MPALSTIACAAGSWTLLTDTPAEFLRCQVQDAFPVHLKATIANTAPTNTSGSVLVDRTTTLAADLSIGELFPSLAANGALYVWLYTPQGVMVSVDYA